MPRVTFIQPDGASRTVEAPVGRTVKDAAVSNMVPGIVAECGGGCACATCHVYVDPDWVAATGKPNGVEDEMLDFAKDRQATSRLSCQMTLTDALDGLVVRVPVEQ